MISFSDLPHDLFLTISHYLCDMTDVLRFGSIECRTSSILDALLCRHIYYPDISFYDISHALDTKRKTLDPSPCAPKCPIPTEGAWSEPLDHFEKRRENGNEYFPQGTRFIKYSDLKRFALYTIRGTCPKRNCISNSLLFPPP